MYLALAEQATVHQFPREIDDILSLRVHTHIRVMPRPPRLAAEFRASPVPFVLMLDDLHEVRSHACHDVVSVVISGIPPGSQLAAASRDEQPHLPRFRVSGDALEFGAGDLALDAASARQIFAHAQVSVPPELAAAAAERTEGWPAGLYLAALIAKESRNQVRTLTVTTGT